MSYRTPRPRRVAPILASVALAVAALGSVPAAHASDPAPQPYTLPSDPAGFIHAILHPTFTIPASALRSHPGTGNATLLDSDQAGTEVAHDLAARSDVAIHSAALAGSGVVTNCSTAGYNASGGAQGIGFGYAMSTYATITFDCNPALSGGLVGGGYFISVPATIEVSGAQSIDGSDGGKNDVVLLGAPLGGGTPTPTTRIFKVDSGAALSLANLSLALGLAPLATPYGGAVASFGSFSANNVTFFENSAPNGGGALELAVDPALATTVDTITNCTFFMNEAQNSNGGAIDIDSAGMPGSQSVTIANSTFVLNQASNDNAGAIRSNNSGATVTIGRSLFAFNTAESGNGGAISNKGGNVSVDSSEFLANHAETDGGAIAELSGQTMTITASSFLGNDADRTGGAFDSRDSGSVSAITNSTFFGNSAGSGTNNHGGAVAVEDGSLKLAASTIDTNQAGDTGGGIFTRTGTSLSIRTTIVSQNTVNNAVLNCEIRGAFTDQGYNLEYSAGAANTCGFTAATDILNKDPLLTLGTYGGPRIGSSGITILSTLLSNILGLFGNFPLITERPGLGSPAINAVPTTSCLDANGAPLTVDERGFARPYPTGGNCDIGAFEVGFLGTTCSAAIGFFAPGGTQFALRTGDQQRAPLISYLSIYGPAGRIRAVPQVPRANVADTLTCVVPDPDASPPATTFTFSVDALVVTSTQPGVPSGTLLRVTAIKTATTETVTVSLVNPDNSTGATLYSFTPYVAPQSFQIAPSPLSSLQFPTNIMIVP